MLAPAAAVAARPPEASWEACGAFPIPALTAVQALDEALEIESGGWVVVNGAGGVTGGLLVQLAAARGARVIATASAKKAERIVVHVEEQVDAGREQQNPTNDPFGGDQAKDAAAAGLIVGFRHPET